MSDCELTLWKDRSARTLESRLGDRAKRQLQLLLFRGWSASGYLTLRRLYQLSRFALRRPHEPDFEAFASLPYPRGLFLDVGASSGTSAMSFRLFQRESPILSVEPNPLLEPDLRFLRRFLRRFDYLILAAGDRSGSATLHVPAYRGVPITGEASLARGAVERSPSLRALLGRRIASPEFHIARRSVEVRPLDDLELHPAYVKVDVQGSELSVLKGLEGTIGRHRPVLMLEKSEELADVRGFLAERGYRPFEYLPREKRLAPYRERTSCWNVFFLPDPPPPTG